jgi:2-hydroxy-3-keto-5-methylthiopentenyl-1-phosphate phosphatase
MKKVAIIYDFDKTLSTKDMQEFGFLESLGFEEAHLFWELCAKRAQNERMDPILAYLYEILVQAKLRHIPITRSFLNEFAHTIEYYPGVETWFTRLNHFAEDHQIKLEHYIISSGLSEMIEHSLIAPFIEKIFACEYLYEHEQAVWPKLAVNYTLKTQFLFRINKGILDINEQDALNQYQNEDERPIPFKNMIYIGDGLTDVPSMKLVKMYGGHAIGVHAPHRANDAIAQQLIQDQRVDFITEAKYTQGSPLEYFVRQILEQLQHEQQ